MGSEMCIRDSGAAARSLAQWDVGCAASPALHPPRPQGGLLVVSHDEHLITSVCETLVIVDEGSVWEHRGDFQSYRKQQLAKSKLK